MYEAFDDFHKQVCEKLMDYLNRILIFCLCKRIILGRDLKFFNFNEQYYVCATILACDLTEKKEQDYNGTNKTWIKTSI